MSTPAGSSNAASLPFAPATAQWFTNAFGAPTTAQSGAWQSISDRQHTLVVAPTGSGKTLAAFLSAIDSLAHSPIPDDPSRRCRVVYISPLKALASDVERNLRSPLVGIEHEFTRLAQTWPQLRVGVRTGDTTQAERTSLVRNPPDILITTPESLYLMLTSLAREILSGVTTVIIDEVHAVAGTKRGAHLAMSLARLDALSAAEGGIQRIGLSATVRPLSAVAQWLHPTAKVQIVNPRSEKKWDLSVVVPVEDMSLMGQPVTEFSGSAAGAPQHTSIWPHVESRIAELIASKNSTIVFANSRRLAERLTMNLNDVAAQAWASETADSDVAGAGDSEGVSTSGDAVEHLLARAHHGSVSKEQRSIIEEALKAGQLPAVVATSSLELGIDMGAVDLVVQVESPPSVASALQRVGRAGHQVGAVSTGVLFPKFRGDLVQTAVVVERMRAGLIEELHIPRNPLDVLAQQIVAMVAMDDWNADDLFTLACACAPFTQLSSSAYESVLDMLAGRYSHEEFADLRPRIVWDRTTNMLTARPGTQRLAVTNGGTIPDRGLFPVLMVGERRRRVGELDEEMVYESRVGDVFALGTSSWRIEDISHDSVLVTPAPGHVGKLPFWKGDTLGRPLELGAAVGAFVREIENTDADDARTRLQAIGLDAYAVDNLISYISEQREVTGYVPSDKTIVVERSRDEIGDWRVIVHSPFGASVHAPWALLVGEVIRERYGFDAQVSHGDDGLVLRLPDVDEETIDSALTDCLRIDPETVELLVGNLAGSTALFASRFRECAARSLLLPKRDPRKRAPLWQQRQRAAQLLSIAAKHSTFPVLLETMREVLQDVYDVPGLIWLMHQLQAGSVRMVECETSAASPFARSMLFGYVAQYLYEGDNPLAERKAAALTLDATLLAELLGTTDLRELLDADVIAAVHADLQRLSPDRQARSAEQAVDMLRMLGPLTADAAAARGVLPQWLDELAVAKRVIEVRIAGLVHYAIIEDSGRLRDALGVALPVGIPLVFTEPVADPLTDLIDRWARNRGPFTLHECAAAFGIGVAVVTSIADQLVAGSVWVTGELMPGAAGAHWCNADVMRRIRRRTVSVLRQQAEPVSPTSLAQFLPKWQGVGGKARGFDGLVHALSRLEGAAIAASGWESLVLPQRVRDYSPAMLDEVLSAGDYIWVGRGGLPNNDGWLSIYSRDAAALLLPEVDESLIPSTPAHRALLAALQPGGAWFFRDLKTACERESVKVSDKVLMAALWDLVWAGLVTNDTLSPLRAYLLGNATKTSRMRAARPARMRVASAAAAALATPASAVGRWSAVPTERAAHTTRLTAAADVLLARHGVLTRGAVTAERIDGGWSAMFPVLQAFDDRGRARRAYVVDGLGGSQFGSIAAIDTLRADVQESRDSANDAAIVLSATDPANAFGAALPWPAQPQETASGHRPGRKAGAIVITVGGELALYVERGGKTLLSFTADATRLASATGALAHAVRQSQGRLLLERADGDQVLNTAARGGSPLTYALETAGFITTPRGLLLR